MGPAERADELLPEEAPTVCGRYTLTLPLDELVEVFDAPAVDFEWLPRFNIAPTQEAPVVVEGSDGRRLGPVRWGLVPHWADDPSIGGRMINARSETVHRKPAFRDAFRERRCLVPADGFYEWREVGGRKQPHWIHRPDRRPFAFAGLWERWWPPRSEADERAEALHTFTILTTDATPELRPIHPRMPVLLPEEAWDRWLARDADPGGLLALLTPWAGDLREHEVSMRVNRPQNDDPTLIDPTPEAPPVS